MKEGLGLENLKRRLALALSAAHHEFEVICRIRLGDHTNSDRSGEGFAMRNTFRVLLVDDEMSARKALRELLGRIPIVEIVGEADSAKTAIPLFNTTCSAIDFPGCSDAPRRWLFTLHLELASPAIIFVTAWQSIAVRAFGVNAVDYLLKPIRPDRLAAALAGVLQENRPSEAIFSG